MLLSRGMMEGGRVRVELEVVVSRGRRVFLIAVAGLMVLPGAAHARQSDAGQAASQSDTPTGAFVVILADGTRVPVSSKPVSAFGTLRYLDATGRTRVLPVSKVDLAATRAANADVAVDGSAGTFSVGGGVVFRRPETNDKGDRQPAAKEENPRAKSVTVYSATWCPHCTRLKKYLAAKGISASIIEVDLLPAAEQGAAMATMERLTGRTAFPTVVIDGNAQAGFSQSWIESALAR